VVVWHIFSILVYCTKKNLATLKPTEAPWNPRHLWSLQKTFLCGTPSIQDIYGLFTKFSFPPSIEDCAFDCNKSFTFFMPTTKNQEARVQSLKGN
jgi:hypothetical protein